MTASVGAVYVRPEDTMDTALARVDTLLYESKNTGRDRVSVES